MPCTSYLFLTEGCLVWQLTQDDGFIRNLLACSDWIFNKHSVKGNYDRGVMSMGGKRPLQIPQSSNRLHSFVKSGWGRYSWWRQDVWLKVSTKKVAARWWKYCSEKVSSQCASQSCKWRHQHRLCKDGLAWTFGHVKGLYMMGLLNSWTEKWRIVDAQHHWRICN